MSNTFSLAYSASWCIFIGIAPRFDSTCLAFASRSITKTTSTPPTIVDKPTESREEKNNKILLLARDEVDEGKITFFSFLTRNFFCILTGRRRRYTMHIVFLRASDYFLCLSQSSALTISKVASLFNNNKNNENKFEEWQGEKRRKKTWLKRK